MGMQVWIMTRRTAKGKPTYHLRWVCPEERRWKARKVEGDKKRALTEAAKLSEELEHGTYRATKKVDWGTFADEHVQTISGEWHRKDTARTLALFAEVCQPKGVHAVTYRMVEAFAKHLRDKRGNTTATVGKRLRVLKAAFRAAIRRGYIGRSPMEFWKFEREDEKLPRALTDDEKRLLLGAAPSTQWRTLILTALTSGCRRGELLGLTWADVDIENARLFIRHTKGKKDRVQPVPAGTAEALKELQAATLKDGGPFRAMGPNHLPHEFKKIVTTAGIAPCTFHDMRRTYCTDLARAGVNQFVVQRLAGHVSSATTARYYLLADDPTKREAIGRLAL